MSILRTLMIQNALKKKGRLPSGYVECDFLENLSTTKNYIDTGILLNTNMRIESQVMVTDINHSGNCHVIGAYAGSVLNINSNGQFYPNASTTTFFDVNLGDKLDVVLRTTTSRYCSVNGIQYSASWSSGNRNKYNILLFNTYPSSDSYYSCGCKIYETKIYDNDVLISDLVPCYRLEDSTSGYYDIIRNEFYTNLGTGNLYAGYDDFDKTYTRVEYIRSLANGVYLSLNKYGTQNSEFNITVKWHSTGTGRRTYGYYSTTSTTKQITLYPASSTANRFGDEIAYISPVPSSNVIHYVKQNKEGIWIDDEMVVTYPEQEDFTTNGIMYLYGWNGSSYRTSRMSLYEFSMKEAGVEIMHLIPCIHKQSGNAVLYDMVQNKTFYITGQDDTTIEIGPVV